MVKPATKPAHMVRKLIAFQVGVTIFGMFTGLVFGGGDMTSLLIVMAMIAIGMHMVMVATAMYEYGQGDYIRVSSNRVTHSSLRGLNIALIANSLNIVLGVISVISKVFVNNIGFFEQGLLEGDITYYPVIWAEIHAISSGIAAIIQAGYLGLYTLYFSGNPLYFLFVPLPSIAVAAVAYQLGYKSEQT